MLSAEITCSDCGSRLGRSDNYFDQCPNCGKELQVNMNSYAGPLLPEERVLLVALALREGHFDSSLRIHTDNNRNGKELGDAIALVKRNFLPPLPELNEQAWEDFHLVTTALRATGFGPNHTKLTEVRGDAGGVLHALELFAQFAEDEGLYDPTPEVSVYKGGEEDAPDYSA